MLWQIITFWEFFIACDTWVFPFKCTSKTCSCRLLLIQMSCCIVHMEYYFYHEFAHVHENITNFYIYHWFWYSKDRLKFCCHMILCVQLKFQQKNIFWHLPHLFTRPCFSFICFLRLVIWKHFLTMVTFLLIVKLFRFHVVKYSVA